MNIVILGTGRIGSVFAFQLAAAGHAVTAVCSGARLQALLRDGAIVAVDGRKAPVRAVAAFEPEQPFDLAIVTVPEHQVGPLLQPLSASASSRVLLMFNSFAGTERYRSTLGADRLAVGFPNMTAFLVQQRLRFRVDGPGMATTVSCQDLAALFAASGLPSQVEADMDAFLRTHVAMVVPLFIAALWTWQRREALTLAEAWRLAGAWRESFDLVRQFGHGLRPRSAAALAALPRWLASPLLWSVGRSSAVRCLGEFGPAETRWLVDAMVAAAPGRTRQLMAVRP